MFSKGAACVWCNQQDDAGCLSAFCHSHLQQVAGGYVWWSAGGMVHGFAACQKTATSRPGPAVGR